MSSCMQPIPLEFQIGGVCAGHGVCVNSSRTMGLLLCKCDQWYSGASDFFDNRVEQLPDGTWLSYSCDQSDVGTYVVWSIFLLCGFLRLLVLVPLWINFYKKHYADKRLVALGIWNDSPFRVVTTDLFGIGIPYFVTGFTKMAGMTFGTDALPTLGIIFSILGYHLNGYDMSKLEFDIFVQGSSSPDEANKAKRFRNALKISGLLASFLFGFVVALWSLTLDKTKGPLARNGGNAEEVAIYLRNIGGVAFAVFDMVATWMIRQRVRMIRLITGRDDDSAVAYIIKKMDNEMRSYIGRICFLAVLHGGLFCIPQMLPYHTYNLALIVGLALSVPHSKAFTTEKEKKKRGFSTVTTTSKEGKSTERSKSSGGKEKEASVERGSPSPSSPVTGVSRMSAAAKRDSVPSVLVSSHEGSKVSAAPVEVPVLPTEVQVSVSPVPEADQQNIVEEASTTKDVV